MRLTRLLSQPVYRLLTVAFVLVALIPLAVLGVKLYHAAWDNAWREITEKHRLLAINLTAPVRLYVNNHRAMLRLLADELAAHGGQADTHDVQKLMADASRQPMGFRSIALVGPDTKLRFLTVEGRERNSAKSLLATETCVLHTRETGDGAISRIKASPISGEPSILLSQPIKDSTGRLRGILLGELRTNVIEELRQQIRFGKKGHSAIVDNSGRVIAHPNPQWIRTMHDLSGLGIVKQMLAGQQGVTEFYSPFVQEQMVAGYAAVPELGWGVMVPQPKSEIAEQVNDLLYRQLGWALAGLLLALVLIGAVVRWLTGPINRLASTMAEMEKSDFQGDPPPMPAALPREIAQLSEAFRHLVRGFQRSRQRVEELNRSLQERVDRATQELRDANLQLEELARRDHLTSLANRRHFENTLAHTLNRRQGDTEPLCIMLIDVDNFKVINDHYGHAAGDTVLMEIANLLTRTMRPGDLVARYGGDEFVAQMRCAPEVGHARAQEIREAIEQRSVFFNGKAIHLTVSIGVLNCRPAATLSTEALLRHVDMAMYEAKRGGRNRVTEIAYSD